MCNTFHFEDSSTVDVFWDTNVIYWGPEALKKGHKLHERNMINANRHLHVLLLVCLFYR